MAGKELKVVRVLKALEDKELERLVLFLDAEYFVVDKSFLKYFRVLCEQLKSGDGGVDQEALFNLVFEGENFSYNKFAKLNSQLLQLVYRFLSVEYLGQDPVRHWGMVIELLQDRLELEVLDLTLPSFERALDKAPDSLEKLRQKLHLREVLFATEGGAWRESRTVKPQWVIEALDEYYELARLRLECAILNRRLISGEQDFQSDYQAPVKRAAENEIIRLYDLARANLLEPAHEGNWLRLKEALELQIKSMEVDQFSPEFREVCTYTLNGCIRLNNFQRKGIAREHLYATYKLLLDHGILLRNDLLSPWHFKNIIKNLVLTERFDEAFSRIEEYGSKLNGDYQENALVYSRALYNFSIGSLEESLRDTHLLLQDYKDVFYGLDGRTLLLRCYFEMADTEQLEMQGEAFRQFLRRLGDRKVLTDAYLEMYAEFVKNITGLGKINFGAPDKQSGRLKRFQTKLENNDRALFRDWLLAKITFA